MHLSLSEAATVLGRSERQLRYLIKTGRLAASKQGGQWRIASADLPLTDAQRRSLAQRLAAAQAAFTEGTAAAAKATSEQDERRHYSVLNLAAFQTGEALYRELDGEPGDQDPARLSLGAALTAIVCGFHSFQPAE